MAEVRAIAQELWGEEKIPTLVTDESLVVEIKQGEARCEGVAYSDRAEYFRSQALDPGCPKAQHSYGLLLWSGFAGIERDSKESAKFHAAAACQNHLDGLAVLGGCLRTGTGISKKNVALGLELIDHCASLQNPTGVNKRAALLEQNQDELGAFHLYTKCHDCGKANALLLFNLGWYHMHGICTKKNRDKGIQLWTEAATNMAPDEGSEEAAWHLSQEFAREDPKQGRKWLDLAGELGYHDHY